MLMVIRTSSTMLQLEKTILHYQSTETVDIIDTGRLFVALNNLINYNSSLAQTIDNIVL